VDAADTGADADAGMGADSGDPGIQCGTSFCDPTNFAQTCCRTGSAPSFSYACTAHSGCTGFYIGDDAHDCIVGNDPQDVCCMLYTDGGATGTDCRHHDLCVDAGVEMCDPMAPVPCPNGGTCTVNASQLPDYHQCE
jgi:hypothetical protein